MTNEDAKRTLQDMWECLFNEMSRLTFEDLEEHGMLANYSKAFEMAMSALSESADIEKIRAEIKAIDPINLIGYGVKEEALDIIDKHIGGKDK